MDRASNVEYRMILLLHFWYAVKHILGHFQVLENVGWFQYLNCRTFPFFYQVVNKKVNKLFNIWCQFQNSKWHAPHTSPPIFVTNFLAWSWNDVHYISNLLLFSIFQVNRAFNFNKTSTGSPFKEGKRRNPLVAKVVAKTWHCSRVLMAFLKVRIFWEGHKNFDFNI